MLQALELWQYKEGFARQGVSGADLRMATDDDLRELGVGLGVHRRRLLTQLGELSSGGVPSDFLCEGGGEGGSPPCEEEEGDHANLCVICLADERGYVLLPCESLA